MNTRIERARAVTVFEEQVESGLMTAIQRMTPDAKDQTELKNLVKEIFVTGWLAAVEDSENKVVN